MPPGRPPAGPPGPPGRDAAGWRLWLDRESPVAPVAPLAVAAWLLWGVLDGGFEPDGWGWSGLALTLLLGVAALAAPTGWWRREGLRVAAFAALAGTVAWSFLSMTWAHFPSDAWESSDKALLYGVSFALFAGWPWGPRAATAALSLFSLGAAVLAAVTVAEASLSRRPVEYFVEGRLHEPIGYANGNVALWTGAAFPAVYVATLRAAPAALRGLAAACAVFLLQVSVLGQARAWVVAAPVAAGLFVLLARQRLRLLAGLALVGAGASAAAPALVDVYARADADATLGPALDRAGAWMAGASLAAGAAAAAWAAVDRRLVPGPRLLLSLRALAVLAGVALLALGLARASSALAHPVRWAEDRWHDFRGNPDPITENGGSRFAAGLGGYRHEEWRIAVNEFRRHPVLGVGAGNYGPAYLLHRSDSYHEPASPHSNVLRLLSEQGAVGAILFLAFASAGLLLALRRRAALSPAGAGAVAAAATVFLYWLVHGAVDWLWELPVLSGPAYGLLGLAGAVAARPGPPSGTAERAARGRALGRLFGGAAVVAALASLALPWLSSSYLEAGAGVWRSSPSLAYARLERAADLNPLAAEPLLVEGSIALKRRDLDVARKALTGAVSREPRNWYAHLQLALVEGVEGRYTRAERRLARARALNPLDRGIALAARLVRRRAPIDPDRVNDVYIAEANRRFGRTIFPSA